MGYFPKAFVFQECENSSFFFVVAKRAFLVITHLGGIPNQFPYKCIIRWCQRRKFASWNGVMNVNMHQSVSRVPHIIPRKKFTLFKVGLSLAVYSSTFFLGCAGNLLILLSVASHSQVDLRSFFAFQCFLPFNVFWLSLFYASFFAW